MVTVPVSLDNWLFQTEEELLLRHCGYWVSLHSAPETTNSTNVTVKLPRTQMFTPEALRQMMQRINDCPTSSAGDQARPDHPSEVADGMGVDEPVDRLPTCDQVATLSAGQRYVRC